MGTESVNVDVWARRYTQVMRDVKLLYTETPKVGCTSVKHALMRANNFDPATIVSDRGEISREMTVHDRGVWRLPSLVDLSPSQHAHALAGDDGWFSFAIVRSPFDRLVSLWAQKVLLHDPTARLFGLDGGRIDGLSEFDLRASLLLFARDLRSDWSTLRSDDHFAPQFDAVRPDLVNYSVIADITDFSDLASRVDAHLAAAGVAFGGFDRHNEGLRLAWSQVGSDAVAEIVLDLYAVDFSSFALSLDPPHADQKNTPAMFHQFEMQLLQEVRVRNERIMDLAAIAQARLGMRYAAHEFKAGALRRVRRVMGRSG